MNGPTQEACPICGRPAQVRRNDLDEETTVDCGTCGHYSLGEDAPSEFRKICNRIPNARGQQLKGEDPGRLRPFRPGDLTAIIGASSAKGVSYVIVELRKKGLLNQSSHKDSMGLSFLGWEKHSELQRAHCDGPIAFMAMPFNVPELDNVYLQCFRPAVHETGFELRRLDEKPPAGLIDVRMEVEIRKSRFFIAELTDENRGVYWEAGFAEGLGKPVIYTCEKAYFEDHRSHFDTAHRHTIVWQADRLDEAAAYLKNTIRATLPSEAKMFEDP